LFPKTRQPKGSRVLRRKAKEVVENRVLGEMRTYPDLVDVVFDHRPGKISLGHFTYGVQRLEE